IVTTAGPLLSAPFGVHAGRKEEKGGRAGERGREETWPLAAWQVTAKPQAAERPSYLEMPLHAVGHLLEFLLAAARHFTSRPAVVADLVKGSQNVGPILVALANGHPAFLLAVALEVEFQHPLAELADPVPRFDPVFHHIAAIEVGPDI